jgi:hypothetical protein
LAFAGRSESFRELAAANQAVLQKLLQQMCGLVPRLSINQSDSSWLLALGSSTEVRRAVARS